MLTGEDDRATGRADRVRDEALIESDPLPRNAVNIRRRSNFRESAAVSANRVAGVIVRHDEENVRTTIGRDRDRGKPNHAKRESHDLLHGFVPFLGDYHRATCCSVLAARYLLLVRVRLSRFCFPRPLFPAVALSGRVEIAFFEIGMAA